MDVIKILKEVVNVAQKSNDVEMIQKVINVQENIIEMQDKIQKLQQENEKLREKMSINKNIQYYRSIPILTLKNDKSKVLYCAVCYGKDGILLPIQCAAKSKCYCSNCDTYSYISNSPDQDKIMEVLK